MIAARERITFIETKPKTKNQNQNQNQQNEKKTNAADVNKRIQIESGLKATIKFSLFLELPIWQWLNQSLSDNYSGHDKIFLAFYSQYPRQICRTTAAP